MMAQMKAYIIPMKNLTQNCLAEKFENNRCVDGNSVEIFTFAEKFNT